MNKTNSHVKGQAESSQNDKGSYIFQVPMDPDTRLKQIQEQRARLLDRFGIFGGGSALNRVFNLLNQEEEWIRLHKEVSHV